MTALENTNCAENARRPGTGPFRLSPAGNQIYSLAVAFITAFSLYDAFLVYKYREVIDEQNEICRWLIELEPTHVSLFLAAKLFGTFAVAFTLLLLGKHWRRVGTFATAALVMFQIGLGYYLHYSEAPRPHPRYYAQLSLVNDYAINSRPTDELAADENKNRGRNKRRGYQQAQRQNQQNRQRGPRFNTVQRKSKDMQEPPIRKKPGMSNRNRVF